VQYNESNYNFIRRLANRFGEWFFYDGSTLQFGNPGKAKKNLMLGIDLIEFDFSMKLEPTKFNWTANDYFKKDVVSQKSRAEVGKGNEYGNYALNKSMDKFSYQSENFFSSFNVQEKNSAKSKKPSDTSSIIQKAVEIGSNSKAESLTSGSGNSTNLTVGIGDKITVDAQDFYSSSEVNFGGYLVTAINHYVDELLHYTNEFKVLPGETTLPETTDPLAIAKCNTQSALVVENEDPHQIGRVKVRFLWQDSGQSTPWLRVITPYVGGKDTGLYFIPEIDDEVIVGFEGDDAERPYVIGSVYNGVDSPDETWIDQNNDIKVLRTKSGNTIKIIDSPGDEQIILYLENEESPEKISLLGGSKPVMHLETSGELIIKSRSMKLDVEEDIAITTKGGGLVIDTGANLSVKTKTDVAFEATAGVSIKGKGNMDLEGAQFSATGKATMDLKAPKTSLKGDAMTEIKGGIVKIN